MPERPTFTEEDTRALINARAREPDGDNFRIKIHRRPGLSGILTHIATLTNAKAEHITYAETWLPKLCGGGQYAISVFPNDSPTQQIGGFINVNFDGPPREVDPSVIRSPGWSGPPGLAFPDMVAPAPQVITHGAAGFTLHTSAANSSVPGGSSPPHSSNPPSDSLISRAEWERLRDIERELHEREKKMREELLFEQARLREERLRSEMAAKLAEIQARKPDDGGTDKLISAAAPIVTAIMQMMNESRSQMLKMQADTQALMLQMQKDAQQRSEELFKLLLARKEDSGAAEMMAKMADVMNTVARTSVTMIEAVADMQFDRAPAEHPGLIAIREFGRAIRAVSAGAQAGAKPSGVYHPALSNGANGSHAYQTFEQQARQPMRPAVAPPASRHAGNGFGDMSSAAVAPPAPAASSLSPSTSSPLDEIVKMIKSYAPPAEVAARFIQALSDPRVQSEIEAHGGSVQSLAVARLGLEWITSSERNQEYLRSVLNEINRLGLEAGIFEPEGVDEEAEEAEETDA